MVDVERTNESAGAQAAPDAESLEKVRDILFGAQVKKSDAHLRALERRLADEAARLRRDMEERFAVLERAMKVEGERVDAQIRDEVAARRVSEAELRSVLEETRKSLDERVEAVDRRAQDSTQALDARLLAITSEMRDEYESRLEALGAKLEDATADLAEDKVSRSELASFFADLSRRLAGEAAE